MIKRSQCGPLQTARRITELLRWIPTIEGLCSSWTLLWLLLHPGVVVSSSSVTETSGAEWLCPRGLGSGTSSDFDLPLKDAAVEGYVSRHHHTEEPCQDFFTVRHLLMPLRYFGVTQVHWKYCF